MQQQAAAFETDDSHPHRQQDAAHINPAVFNPHIVRYGFHVLTAVPHMTCRQQPACRAGFINMVNAYCPQRNSPCCRSGNKGVIMSYRTSVSVLWLIATTL